MMQRSFSRSRTPLSTLALLAGGLTAPAQAQTLWRVDAGNPPGTDFTDVPAAVAAASPGDVILVGYEPGVFYTAPTLDKAVALVADPEPVAGTVALPSMLGQLVIEHVHGTLPVRVDAFGVFGVAADQPALVVRDCSAPVILESLTVEPGDPSAAAGVQRAAATVEASGPVVLVRSGIESFGGFVFNEPGYRGLDLVDSEVFVYSSEIRGAAGMDAYFLGGSIGVVQASDGQTAVRASGGRLFLSDSIVRGGRGGDGLLSGGCNPPGAGGNGVEASSGLVLTRVDSIVGGRPAGAPGLGCPPGVDGLGFVPAGASQVSLPGEAPRITPYPLVWRTGGAGHYSLQGAPGELVALTLNASLFPLELPVLPGLLLPLTAPVLDLGPVSASGTLDLAFNVPPLPGPREVSILQLQSAHLDPTTLLARLGPPVTAVWVATGQ